LGHDDPNPMCSGANTCSGGNCIADGGKKHFGQTCGTGADCFSTICSGQFHTCI
jgi:hypothetical protein